MLHRRDFANFSSSLATLTFADNVVLALARARKSGSLREEDRNLLHQVDEFFERVLSGYGWRDNPQLSRGSVQSAAAFSDAVGAVAIGDPTKFLEHIKKLRVEARSVEAGGADADAIEELQRFFTDYGYSGLQRTMDVANQKNVYRGRSWLRTTQK